MGRITRSTTSARRLGGLASRKTDSTTSFKNPINDITSTIKKRSALGNGVPDHRLPPERVKVTSSIDSTGNTIDEAANTIFSAERARSELYLDTSPSSKVTLSERKWRSWSKDAHSSPFKDFPGPTEQECRESHKILDELHGETVRKNFEYTENPEMYYPYVMNALVVATLSQATSWANAKRAMKSMTEIYGSPFAYQQIMDGGEDKLKAALRPGGMQNRKAKMLLQILEDVRERHGEWNLDHLFGVSDDDAVKELISYKGVGPKSAFCILSICLQRKSFAVDTHIYRIAGLWGWRPNSTSREKAQAHLDARIPDDIKFSLHYLLIVHGQECPVCRANGNPEGQCKYKELLKKTVNVKISGV